MPTFISDPSEAVFVVLVVATAVIGFVWFNWRTRRTLIAFVVALAILSLIVLIDWLVESPREEAVRRVQAMATAADTRDTEAFVSHLAESVEYRGTGAAITLKRDDLRRANFWNILRQLNVHVATWDFSRHDVSEIDANTVEIGFMAKGESSGKPFPIYFRTTFRRQPDGQMKLTSIASFDPIKRTNEAIELGGYLK
jgi:hypothetical protein